jgi:hypothetical protein
MLLSCAPNVLAPIANGTLVDTGMLALASLHVVAWAVTVQMLLRLGVKRVVAPDANKAGAEQSPT